MRKFIEKIAVLKNEKNSVVRLYIDHDGQRCYSIQRSNCVNGRLSHFFNKKVWYSPYHVTSIFEREIFLYEQKGYEVIEEFELDMKPIQTSQFRFDNHSLTTANSMMKIGYDAVPLTINASFKDISITDMRYNKAYVDSDLTSLLNDITHMICFVPFISTVIYEPSSKTLTVMRTDYQSKPKPSVAYQFENLMSQAKTSITQGRYEDKLVLCQPADNGTFALFHDNIITFHFLGWKAGNFIVERQNSTAKEFQVFAMKNGTHCLIHSMALNIDHNQHAMLLINIHNNEVFQALFVETSNRTKPIAQMNYIKEAKPQLKGIYD